MKSAGKMRDFELKLTILRALICRESAKMSTLASEFAVGKKKICELADELCAASLIERVGENLLARKRNVCFVLLKIYRDHARLSFRYSDECERESVELRSAPALSDADNVARYLSVAERVCSEMSADGKRVLAIASLEGNIDDLTLPSGISCACRRENAIARYLQIVGERSTTLYISLAHNRLFESYLFHNAEFVGNGAATGVFDASSLCTAFDFLKPERLIVQSNRAIVQETQIRDICKARQIETDFFCGKELTPEAQGMIDILLENELMRLCGTTTT